MKVSQLFSEGILFLNEGISNLNHSLAADVLSLFPDNFFTDSFSHPISRITFRKIYKVENKFFQNTPVTITIHIELIEDRTPVSKIGSIVLMKDAHKNIFTIQVHVRSYFHDVILIKSAIVHELTHISQVYNGALQYTHSEFLAKNPARPARMSRRRFYIRQHQTVPGEQEAVLLSLFQIIVENEYDQAVKFALDRAGYLKGFDHKQFVKKAYEFGLVNQHLERFRIAVDWKIQNTFTSQPSSNLRDDRRDFLLLSRMLNLSTQQIQKLRMVTA